MRGMGVKLKLPVGLYILIWGSENLLAVKRGRHWENTGKIEKWQSWSFLSALIASRAKNGSKVKFLFDFSFEKLDFAFSKKLSQRSQPAADGYKPLTECKPMQCSTKSGGKLF